MSIDTVCRKLLASVVKCWSGFTHFLLGCRNYLLATSRLIVPNHGR